MPAKEDELGGLWESATREGEVYLKGKIDGVDVVLFKNRWKKEGERTPDWRVYKSQPRTGENTPAPAATPPRAAQAAQQPPAYAPQHQEDDMPF